MRAAAWFAGMAIGTAVWILLRGVLVWDALSLLAVLLVVLSLVSLWVSRVVEGSRRRRARARWNAWTERGRS